MPYPHLLEPLTLRGLELRNRVVFPAMATGMIDDGGYVTDQLIAYHVARAVGGNGLNITEAASVHAPSAPRNFLNVSDDAFEPGLRRFTDAIRSAGGRSCIQLWQGGMVASMMDPEAQLITPSGLDTADGHVPGVDIGTIAEVVAAWGAAAARAVRAGFDCVEFHCAHNYSPHAFLSGGLNQRTDEYGGSFENRARYPLACIRAIRAAIPTDMPLLMRIDAHDDQLKGGLTLDDVIRFCRLAGEAGVDALDISRGNVVTSAVKYEVPPIDVPRGFNVANAAAIRRATGLPTIAVGRINDPAQAERILADGQADMVVIGRGQIADPEFCVKAAGDRAEDIVACVACNQGCYDRYMDPAFAHISCLRNPMVGREAQSALELTVRPRRVLVAGGGMAGMEAAIILAQRGHQPVLCEATDQLGGQFEVAGLAPRKAEMRDAALSRARQVASAGVEIRVGTPLTPALVDALAPDVVINATGARPVTVPVPGADLPHVTDSISVLTGRVAVSGRAVVIGGGLVGLEVAEYLAERGVAVTVVEMLDAVGKDLGSSRQICVLENLAHAEVELLVDATCTAITASTVVVEQAGALHELACDAVVVAIGSAPDDHTTIAEHCATRGIDYHVVGDAVSARRAIDAIAEANALARVL